jgi:hypothetical protein
MPLSVALLGWLIAIVCGGALWYRVRTHRCPIDPPTRAVLLSRSGLPESIRTLRGAPPATYSRPRGRAAARIYARIGTAAVYQTTSE